MRISVLTCFPEFFSGTFCSLLGKALESGILELNLIDLKNYGVGKHKKIDDTPYGGGGGLIMMPEVVEAAMNDNFLIEDLQKNDDVKLIIPSPRGVRLTQERAKGFANFNELIILCNRYEGVDQRVIEFYGFEEVCVGEFILMGGETAAMCVIESSCRFVEGVIKNRSILESETFSGAFENDVECDHYTKPRVWNGLEVPDVLLCGDHAKIAKWKGVKGG
jgi:tRNA (guanine37-N1)-methyltransferase